ncbi:hypothetical protein [Mycobacterium sp. ITM-2016-00317]|uniref:hypothetical protein n=1 Tax=Mycobacterium sp. ITM-2016-00317 TaxID=2099694 RepID=UPI0037CA853A
MSAPRTVPNALIGVLAASALLIGCTSSAEPDPAGPSVTHATPSMAAGPAPAPPAAPAPAAPGRAGVR